MDSAARNLWNFRTSPPCKIGVCPALAQYQLHGLPLLLACADLSATPSSCTLLPSGALLSFLCFWQGSDSFRVNQPQNWMPLLVFSHGNPLGIVPSSLEKILHSRVGWTWTSKAARFCTLKTDYQFAALGRTEKNKNGAWST